MQIAAKRNAFAKTKPLPILSRQILLMMKCTAILLLAACLSASAGTSAQTVSLSEKRISLEKALLAIKKQSGYNLFYKVEMLQAYGKPVDVNIKNVSVPEALQEVFRNQTLTYEVAGTTIIVKEKSEKKLDLLTEGLNPRLDISPPPPPNPDVTITVLNTDNQPLEGASIIIKGQNKGIATDINGRATLRGVDPNATVIISFTGYVNQEYKLSSNPGLKSGVTNLTALIRLAASTNELDQVQIIAYGSTSKRLQTGNVTTVKGEDIEKQPVNNPLLALEGRVPGLFITQVNGIPGGGISIQIQGQNSIGSGNDPLYVIDGVPYPSQNQATVFGGASGTPGILGKSSAGSQFSGNPLSYINASDIESISVLKDADATAIYGSRAANGAILITTKKGKAGPTKLDITLQQGWGKVGHFLDLMNSQQYLQMRKEGKRNDNTAVSSSDYDLNGLWDSTRYTDWQKVMIGGTAGYSNYGVTISGGTTNIQYLVGGTYHRETTVFPGNFANQDVSVHFNISSTSANQKFHFQFSGSYLSDHNSLPGIDLTQYVFLAPVAPALYNPDGTLNWAPNPNASGNSSWVNPLAQQYNLYDNTTSSLVSNATLSYRILPGLELKSNFGFTSLTANEFAGVLINSIAPESRPAYTRTSQFSFNTLKSWIIEPQLNYNRNIWNGKIDVLVGASVQQQGNDGKQITASGFANDQLMKDLKSATSWFSGVADISDYKYNGGFGRINYNWQDKYMINLTARRDGSSRFGDYNRFHNFASAGLGWIFSQEVFAKKYIPFLSFGKLKGSYGTTGNDQIGNYSYLNLYNSQAFGNPYQGVTSQAPGGLSNPYLQWEETRKLALGIDLGFWKDRVLISAMYNRNRSSNEVINYTLSTVTGFTSIKENFPALVQNTSWEFLLNTRNISTNQFSWSSSFNLTIPQNKLISFPGLAQSSFSGKLYIGQPLTILNNYSFYGVDPATGTYLVRNVNGTPTSSPNFTTDLTVFYTTLPKFYGGFQNSFNYKGFQLDFLLQFVSQVNNNFYGNPAAIPGSFGAGKGNQTVSELARWQKPGDISFFARFSSNFQGTSGDRVVEDLSYARLKNLSFSYQFGGKFIKKAHLQNLGLFLNAQNVFTLTPYKGFDPENLNTTTLPPLRVVTLGIKVGI
ncbi:MAG: SusC/RagA family TonB-linked outer membrane protein [Bacteroidota bacterium]